MSKCPIELLKLLVLDVGSNLGNTFKINISSQQIKYQYQPVKLLEVETFPALNDCLIDLTLFSDCNSFIIPNEIPTILSIIYSNIPPLKIGKFIVLHHFVIGLETLPLNIQCRKIQSSVIIVSFIYLYC